jgi:hypothetical protein
MFRSDSAERANREPTAGVSLQMFYVGSRPVAGFFEGLYLAMAVLAAHELIALCKGFVDGAWEPTPTHFHLALRHHRRFIFGSH